MGTSVRERKYEASIAKTTASASGTKRKRATPERKNIGRKTMQMQSVETSAGTEICAAPSRMASCELVAFFEIALDVFDGDGGVVDEDADGEREAAERHDVDRLADAG